MKRFLIGFAAMALVVLVSASDAKAFRRRGYSQVTYVAPATYVVPTYVAPVAVAPTYVAPVAVAPTYVAPVTVAPAPVVAAYPAAAYVAPVVSTTTYYRGRRGR